MSRFSEWDVDEEDSVDPDPSAHYRIIRDVISDKKKKEQYEIEDEEEEEEEEAANEDDAADEEAAAKLKNESQTPVPKKPESGTTTLKPTINIVKLNDSVVGGSSGNKSLNSTTVAPPTNSSNSSGSKPAPSKNDNDKSEQNRPAFGFPAFPKNMPKPTTPPSPVQSNGQPAPRAGEIYLPAGYNNLEIPKLNIGKSV